MTNNIKGRMWTALMAVCILMGSCKQESQTTTAAGHKTMKVKKSDKEVTTGYSATIRGCQDIEIMPQVSGTITGLYVKEGQAVRRGQVLFVIDRVPYQAALQTAKANVEVARAAVATAELNYGSQKELFEQKVVSEYSMNTAHNALLTAQAQLAKAKAEELNARNNLSYTEVKSPCNGVIGALPYRAGALVGPSMPQPLTTVSDNSVMHVYFSMNENRLASMTRQYGSMEEAMKNMPPVELRMNDGSIYDKKGVIESISGVIDRQTGTVSVRVRFPNESRLLHSGASGSVIVHSRYKDCIVIPQGAAMQIQDRYLVYKVVDGKAVSAIVKVAPVNDGREYVVLEGLSAGDEIVAEGAGLVREGMPVK